MKKRNEKTITGEGGKGKRGRTASDDAGGKSLSDTSTSARGQCVGESSGIFRKRQKGCDVFQVFHHWAQ